MTDLVRHGTSSVFFFGRGHNATWQIGLIWNTHYNRWMIPGGHIEPNENPAQTAVREVNEETGLNARLIPVTPLGTPPQISDAIVVAPLWIIEEDVPPERREPRPHIHIDHLYLAATTDFAVSAPGGSTLTWYSARQFAELDLFENTAVLGNLLFSKIDGIVGMS